MKIRTQLVLAWLVLSILPLSLIVLYSYYSSRRAVEGAYQNEAKRLAAQMDRRLTTIRSDLDQRLASLTTLNLPSTGGTGANTAQPPVTMVDSILMAMGESAPLVDALEFVPARTAPRAAARPEPRPVAVAEVTPPPPPEVPAVAAHAAPTEPAAPVIVVRSNPDVNIVVEMPEGRRPTFVMPADFNQRISEITRLSLQLAHNAPDMTDQQRAEIRNLLNEKQMLLDESMKESKARFDEQMKEANRAREGRQKVAPIPWQFRYEQRRVERTQVLPQRQASIDSAALTPAKPKPVAAKKSSVGPKKKQTTQLFSHKFLVPVHKEGEVVGQIRAQLSTEEVVRRILGTQTDDSSEIPFAIDREGNVYTRNDQDRAALDKLGIPQRFKEKRPLEKIEGWIVAISWHKDSGLRVGVARPVGENLQELRRTAARNFGFGMGLIAFALVGIIPLANRATRDVQMVTQGAERIADGDLTTRLPVRSNSEFGHLARAFNQMAEDLSKHREQEIRQRVLALEYERKSVELEDARTFQLSMLPKSVPRLERYDVAVFTQTAAEVGGDYYDFHVAPDGPMSVTIGDATGHGAKAGTMVTVIKTLFAGYDSDLAPAEFLRDAAEKIKRMDLGRMAMALSLARFDGARVAVASAGMPPMLVHRVKDSSIEEVAVAATPLGTLGMEYHEAVATLNPHDTILLMSDGFPELQNAAGQQLGYVVATQEFANAAKAATAQGVIDALAEVSKAWHGDAPPNDDITFVVVRFT